MNGQKHPVKAERIKCQDCRATVNAAKAFTGNCPATGESVTVCDSCLKVRLEHDKDKAAWRTVYEVAVAVDLSPELIYRAIRLKKLRAERVNGDWQIADKDVARWMRTRNLGAHRQTAGGQHEPT